MAHVIGVLDDVCDGRTLRFMMSRLDESDRVDRNVLRMLTKYDNAFIFHVVKNNDYDGLEYLNCFNAINVVNSRGQNVFHYVVCHGTMELLNTVLGMSFDLFYEMCDRRMLLDDVDDFGNSPLDLSLQMCRFDISVRLCQERHLMSVRHLRCSLLKYSTDSWVESVLRYSLVDAKSIDNTFSGEYNLLHKLILGHSSNLIQRLLDYGVSADRLTLTTLESPISLAKAKGFIDIIQMLRNALSSRQ